MEKVTIIGEHDSGTLSQLYDVAKDAERVAIMADGHHGYYMPIGGVAAYKNKVCPAGVGYDIACGNAAARTNIRLDSLNTSQLEDIGGYIWDEIAFGLKRGRLNPAKDAPSDHKLFNDPRWNIIPAHDRKQLKQKARDQLGTTGSGNHYVDLLVDEDRWVWVGVHFGSRGFGHTVARKFMAIAAGGTWDEGKAKEQGHLLGIATLSGQDYWNLMELAGEYAYAGRDWVVDKVCNILGARQTYNVHNHHNFAWREEHFGTPGQLIVVRKGATPAFPDQEGFVGGSMGDNAVILKGSNKGRWEGEDGANEVLAMQRSTMCSTVHGAGRVMSRGQAKREINQTDVDEWLENFGVLTFGGGLDESPMAYRRLEDVLEYQGPTIEVVHTLKPVVVCMA